MNESIQQNQVKSDPVNNSFKCPEQFGYFTDVRDCTRYFVCVFGEPLHETCTGGLYFSSELQTCDWPQNVDCTQKYHIGYSGENDILHNINKVNSSESDSEEINTQSPDVDYAQNDLDNPEFDESIASFVDQNGDVYVHDDPDGLYKLLSQNTAISDHSKQIFNIPTLHNEIEKV